jgi:hypothetical protein
MQIKPVFFLRFFLIVSSLVFCLQVATAETKALQDVKINKTSFNPSMNEKCELAYKLAKDAAVTVYVYTSDFDLVKILENGASKRKGVYQTVWDGTDQDGNLVPDEAYFFCLEASFKGGTKEIYDPTTFSGGEEFEIEKLEYDQPNGVMKFSLTKPARLLIRAGIKNGPLINSLVNWEPRPEGHNLVYWSGFDADGVYDIRNLPATSISAGGFYLPESSVITYGNKKYDYFAYRKDLKTVTKPRREEVFRPVKISPNYYYSREEDRAPRFTVELPDCNQEDPRVKEQLLIRITVDDGYKKFLLKNRFEVAVFLDGKFVLEEEEGYTPFNVTWKTRGIKPGQHYLTVTLATYLGQVASKTLKINIEK